MGNPAFSLTKNLAASRFTVNPEADRVGINAGKKGVGYTPYQTFSYIHATARLSGQSIRWSNHKFCTKSTKHILLLPRYFIGSSQQQLVASAHTGHGKGNATVSESPVHQGHSRMNQLALFSIPDNGRGNPVVVRPGWIHVLKFGHDPGPYLTGHLLDRYHWRFCGKPENIVVRHGSN